MNPFSKFEEWYNQELFRTEQNIPSACCLSTIGLDGYPNARFLSFKSLVDEHFIITGSISSRKGRELKKDPKAALTFWWTETEKQVRVQGAVTPLEEHLSNYYFKERTREAQLISTIFDQGKEIESRADLLLAFEKAKKEIIKKIFIDL